MSAQLPPVRCDDESTWRHKGEKIDLPRLLQLIEQNGGPEGLDLHGCDMSRIDARPDALRPYRKAYADQHGPYRWPLWLGGRGGINLTKAHLEEAKLDEARMENASLLWAELRDASLLWAQLQNADLYEADLEEAHLFSADLRGADLLWAHLESALLVRADLRKADLTLAYLQGADLRYAHMRGALCYGAHLDRTRLRREQVAPATGDELAAKGHADCQGDFHQAKEAYLALKTNFESIGRYDDAGWAYVKEQQMQKALHFPGTLGHRWIRRRVRRGHRLWLKRKRGRLARFLRAKLVGRLHWAWLHVCLFLGLCPREIRQQLARWTSDGRERDEWLSRWRWARNWAYELLTGYGEHWWKPVIWALAVVLCFALGYSAAGNVASGDGSGTHDFLTALTHSIAAFATVGFNTLEPVGWGARLLTAIEAMFGIGLFALFVFTLGNRMRRS